MAGKRKRVEYVHLFAKITRQEIVFESSGAGSEQYPLRIGTYIELGATLDKPLKAVSTVEVSLSEAAEGILGTAHTGMVHRIKPMIYVSLWADTRACDRLVSVIAAQRLSDLYLTIEPPRYGKAWVQNWQVRTAPELE
jgi:hypothetical protein